MDGARQPLSVGDRSARARAARLTLAAILIAVAAGACAESNEAEALSRRVVDLAPRVYGDNHRRVAMFEMDLARLIDKMGKSG